MIKLLITNAFNWQKDHIQWFSDNGFKVWTINREDGTIPDEYYECDCLICNWLLFHHHISNFRNLKYVHLLSAGLDRIDLDYCSTNNITVDSARGVYSIPMAEYAICGVLQLLKQSFSFYKNQIEKKWQKCRSLKELNNLSVLIVGAGNVGTECAKRFKAFTNNVSGIDLKKDNQNPFFDRIIELHDFDKVLPDFDVVVLTLPLTKESFHLFDDKRFSKMKKGSILVNISRGQIIKTESLIAALNNHLGGAVLDVFEEEPLSENNELWNLDNVIITPHNSFVSQHNDERMWETIKKNLTKHYGQ